MKTEKEEKEVKSLYPVKFLITVPAGSALPYHALNLNKCCFNATFIIDAVKRH